jgi:hypothetical protein
MVHVLADASLAPIERARNIVPPPESPYVNEKSDAVAFGYASLL